MPAPTDCSAADAAEALRAYAAAHGVEHATTLDHEPAGAALDHIASGLAIGLAARLGVDVRIGVEGTAHAKRWAFDPRDEAKPEQLDKLAAARVVVDELERPSCVDVDVGHQVWRVREKLARRKYYNFTAIVAVVSAPGQHDRLVVANLERER